MAQMRSGCAVRAGAVRAACPGPPVDRAERPARAAPGAVLDLGAEVLREEALEGAAHEPAPPAPAAVERLARRVREQPGPLVPAVEAAVQEGAVGVEEHVLGQVGAPVRVGEVAAVAVDRRVVALPEAVEGGAGAGDAVGNGERGDGHAATPLPPDAGAGACPRAARDGSAKALDEDPPRSTHKAGRHREPQRGGEGWVAPGAVVHAHCRGPWPAGAPAPLPVPTVSRASVRARRERLALRG